MEGLWFDYQASTPNAGHVGSVMTEMVNAFRNGTPLEAYESNGYAVLKAVGRDDLLFVIDPETGIVRDINTINGFCGAYCYYDLQTWLAVNLGNSLLNSEPWLNRVKDAGKKGGDDYYYKDQIKKKTKIEKQMKDDEDLKNLLHINSIPIPGDFSIPFTAGILATIYLYITNTISTTIPDYKWETTTYNNTTNVTKLIIRKST